MTYTMEQIAAQLKKARLEKGLTQGALSSKAGIPQSHISKIESGLVDLQTLSLIELARTLELELMLIPRTLTHTVEALKKGMDGKDSEPRPMYRLPGDENEE